VGIHSSLAPRTLQALKLLDLVDSEGEPTEDFVAFKKAPHTEAKAFLGNLIRQAYKPIFLITGTDPSKKSMQELEDAFRSYSPDGMRRRMVTLFLGLCEYTEIIDKRPVRRGGGSKGSPVNRSRSSTATKTASRSTAKSSPPAVPEMEPAIAVVPKRLSPPSEDTTTVQLRSGGSVTLSLNVSLLELDPGDRKFVLELVDKVKEYQNQPALGMAAMFDTFSSSAGKQVSAGVQVQTDAESRVQTETPPKASGEGS